MWFSLVRCTQRDEPWVFEINMVKCKVDILKRKPPSPYSIVLNPGVSVWSNTPLQGNFQ